MFFPESRRIREKRVRFSLFYLSQPKHLHIYIPFSAYFTCIFSISSQNTSENKLSIFYWKRIISTTSSQKATHTQTNYLPNLPSISFFTNANFRRTNYFRPPLPPRDTEHSERGLFSNLSKRQIRKDPLTS